MSLSVRKQLFFTITLLILIKFLYHKGDLPINSGRYQPQRVIHENKQYLHNMVLMLDTEKQFFEMKPCCHSPKFLSVTYKRLLNYFLVPETLNIIPDPSQNGSEYSWFCTVELVCIIGIPRYYFLNKAPIYSRQKFFTQSFPCITESLK